MNYILKKIFYIILPPPNITGEIHIGHFLQYFIINIVINWKKIQGYNIIYSFGFDHAGISTYIKFKKKKNIYLYLNYLKKKIKYQLNFIKFKIKKIEFTLNKKYNKMLKNVFFFLFKKKNIFINKKMLNYDIKIKSVISDIEIKKKHCKKFLFYIKYKLKNNYFFIATSNIVSIINDSLILINKKDKRYSNFFYKKILTPFKKKIKIFNFNVNIKFGSGILKISPSSNINDFLLSIKYKNNFLSFLDNNNKIKINNFYFKNNYFYKIKKIKNYKIKLLLKKKIFYYLKKNNYILCIKKYNSSIFNNEKTKTKIIPLILDQFFLKLRKLISLKKILKITKILPNKYNKLFFKWIKNISDWCISRQINWGIKIPLFIDKKKYIFLNNSFRNINKYNLKEVFDTWFNSSMWIIFINKNKNFNFTLISGFDILFFWIIKIFYLNIFFLKKILLDKIFLHGLLKDKFNKKISKTKNNSINFNYIKNILFLIKKFFLKNINNENLNFLIYFLKIFFFYKLYKNYINKYIIILNYYKNIFFLIKKFNYFNFYNLNIFFNNNFISKKIFLLYKNFFFPINNIFIYKKWHFKINILFYNFLYVKNYIIFKILNKIYFFKNLRINNYFEIYFNIKVFFYVKYKNKII